MARAVSVWSEPCFFLTLVTLDNLAYPCILRQRTQFINSASHFFSNIYGVLLHMAISFTHQCQKQDGQPPFIGAVPHQAWPPALTQGRSGRSRRAEPGTTGRRPRSPPHRGRFRR